MTIRNNIYGNTRVRSRNNRPLLFEYDASKGHLDPELRRLKRLTVKDTPNNREHCYWTDSISQSSTILTAATLIGTGLKLKATSKRIKDILEGFCEEINVGRQTIEDYITSSLIDNFVHAGSYWRNDEDHKEYTYNVDIQRIDPKTLTLRKEYYYGWRTYIQNVGMYKSFRSKEAYYRSVKKNFPLIKIDPYNTTGYIVIKDEPNVLLRANYFFKPPIASALHYITYKRYILYFMRKFSQKFWTPFILFLVGDPKTNYYPDTDADMQDRIDELNDLIPDMANFGGMVAQGDVRVEELGKQSARGSEIYVTYMNALDKQIALSLFSSMGIRDASGNDLSTQRGVKEGWYQFIESMRRRIKITIETFFRKVLLPANGIKAVRGDAEIEYSPLKFEASEEVMRAIELGRQTGMFKDRNELRKAGKGIWGWLEPVEETKNGKIDFQMPIQSGNSLYGTRSASMNDKQKNKGASSTTLI